MFYFPLAPSQEGERAERLTNTLLGAKHGGRHHQASRNEPIRTDRSQVCDVMFSSEPILRLANRFEPTDQRALSNRTDFSGRKVAIFFTHGTPVKSPARSRLCRMW